MLHLTLALTCIISLLFTTNVDAGFAKALQGTYERLKAIDQKRAEEWVNKHIIHRNSKRQSGDPIVDFATTVCNTYLAIQNYSTCYGALYGGMASSETAYCDKKYAELEQCVSTQKVSQCANSQTSYDQCQNYTIEAYDYCIEDPGWRGVSQLIDCADNNLEVNPPAILVSSLPPPPPNTASGFTTTFSIAIPPVTSTSPPAVVSIGASTDGTCGGIVGYFCQGTVYGDCCSSGGYCGNTTLFCGAGCQSDYGDCWGSSSSLLPPPTQAPVQGGPLHGPLSSANAPTPSSSTSNLLPPIQGGPLQGPLSVANVPTSSSSSSALPPAPTSPGGTCGGISGYNCYGSNFGYCCSSQGFCGDDSIGPGYCGAGCQSAFGLCASDFGSGSNSSPLQGPGFGQLTGAASPQATPSSSVSPDVLSIILGQPSPCGPGYGSCPGGQCCGASGQCGAGLNFCSAGCQSGYGTCWALQVSGSTSVYAPTAVHPGVDAAAAVTTSACTPGMRKRRVRIG